MKLSLPPHHCLCCCHQSLEPERLGIACLRNMLWSQNDEFHFDNCDLAAFIILFAVFIVLYLLQKRGPFEDVINSKTSVSSQQFSVAARRRSHITRNFYVGKITL
uniref:Uncharacterized protein n=1 Tax=Micrurus lemniscatus lemniscatus TaxID=129467 RepID=A0A2D4H6V6_MICLE